MLYSAYYFSCSTLQSRYVTLGLVKPLNYGLSMPPGRLRRREMGNAETFCGNWPSCSSSHTVAGRTGWLLTDGMQSVSLKPASSADCRTNSIIINCVNFLVTQSAASLCGRCYSANAT